MTSEDILKLKDNLFNVADEIRTEWRELHNKLSVSDLKRTDIEHYMELHDLSASLGYKAYKMLQEVLKERRNVKNRIEELKPLMEFLNNTKLFDNNRRNQVNQTLQKKMDFYNNENENRKYKARILTELFESESVHNT